MSASLNDPRIARGMQAFATLSPTLSGPAIAR